MRAIVAIAVKDLRLLLRDRGDVFFTFVFPVLIAVLFGFVFGSRGGGSRIEVALVRESSSRLADGIASDLLADDVFETRAIESRARAIEEVQAGRATAAVILPATLDAGLEGLFAGTGIALEVVVDPTRQAEAGLIQGKLNELAFRQFPKMLGEREEMARLFRAARSTIADASGLGATQKLLGAGMITAAESFTNSLAAEAQAAATPTPVGFMPIAIRVDVLEPKAGKPRAAFDVTFPQGIVWGLAGCFGAFAASLVTERTRGTLARLRLAPITSFHLVSGKAIACLVAGLLVQALVFAVAILFFGSSIAQPAMLALACFASAFAFAGLAMALAGFCRTEAEANGAGRGAVLILALIGGGTIPLFLMPPFLKTLSYGSPFRWAVAAIEGPFWRDVPISEQIAPLVVLFAIGMGGWVVGARALGWTLRR